MMNIANQAKLFIAINFEKICEKYYYRTVTAIPTVTNMTIVVRLKAMVSG